MARTQESSASGPTQESSAPGPQLAGSMSRTRTWVSVGVDAGFSELLETSPPSSLTLATSGSFSPRNSSLTNAIMLSNLVKPAVAPRICRSRSS